MMKNKDFFRELVASAPEHAEKPQPILACIDFSDATAGVIGETATLACATKAAVELVYVVPEEHNIPMLSPGGVAVVSPVTHDKASALAHVREFVGILSQVGVKAEAKILSGNVVDEILAEVESIRPQRVVVGSHGHSALYELVVGSVAEGLLRRSNAPVVIVPCRKGRK
jgi:nucleotide-binding universal stress UspA family protein